MKKDNINGYLRQKEGRKRTMKVKSSRRPVSIPSVSTHLTKPGNAAKDPLIPVAPYPSPLQPMLEHTIKRESVNE